MMRCTFGCLDTKRNKLANFSELMVRASRAASRQGRKREVKMSLKSKRAKRPVQALIENVVDAARRSAREARAAAFRGSFTLSPETRILDIGSEKGTNIASVLRGAPVAPANVHIADIDEALVKEGQSRFGFTPVPIPETGRLPFEDGFFDIVYCSSVIEHVTLPKKDVWAVRDEAAFREAAWARQQEFAREIARLGKAYFVQTPCRSFPIESHTWLPFAGYLPRRALVPLLKLSNRFWVKQTTPDWALLDAGQMQQLFPDAAIEREHFLGLTKSIMAIRRAPPAA